MCSLTLQDNASDIVWACMFSPKGDTIVSASQDRTLKIWDVALGTCKAMLEGHRYLCLFPPYSCVVCIAVAVYALCTVTGGEA